MKRLLQVIVKISRGNTRKDCLCLIQFFFFKYLSTLIYNSWTIFTILLCYFSRWDTSFENNQPDTATEAELQAEANSIKKEAEALRNFNRKVSMDVDDLLGNHGTIHENDYDDDFYSLGSSITKGKIKYF